MKRTDMTMDHGGKWDREGQCLICICLKLPVWEWSNEVSEGWGGGSSDLDGAPVFLAVDAVSATALHSIHPDLSPKRLPLTHTVLAI